MKRSLRIVVVICSQCYQKRQLVKLEKFVTLYNCTVVNQLDQYMYENEERRDFKGLW